MLICGLLAGAALAAPAANADEVRARMTANRDAYRQVSDTFAIGPARLQTETVPVFGRLQAEFVVRGTYANPFDPADIQVDGVITRPDGRVVEVPAFYFVPYEPVRELTQLTSNVPYRAAGAPGWRLRFAPDTPGAYRLVLRARDARGRVVESAPQNFRAESSSHHGFVRVAPGNAMFFENSGDGSLFWPVGTNVAYTRSEEARQGARGTPSYEYYFGQARGKMNATRVWLCHWSWLEWTPQQDGGIWPGYAGAGFYNQLVAGGLDRVFALAEAQGLRVMLVTEDNNEFSKTESPAGGWSAHPYNRSNGGPCAEPEEFFPSAEARCLYRNRLRYILARWGYSESLWALNSWNDYSNPGPEQLAWLREMHDYVHRVVGEYRPIIYGTNFRFGADAISDYRQAGHGPVKTDKPNVVQECYYSRDPASFRPELHEQLWHGLGSGLAGIMVWSHVLVDRTGAWDEFLPLMRFVENLPLHRHAWRSLNASVTAARASVPGPYRRAVTLRAYGDVPDWGAKPPQNRFAVDLNQSHQWLEGYSRTLFSPSAKSRDWRNPPVFTVNLPTAAELLVELSEFSGRSTTLHVAHRSREGDAWREVAHRTLQNGRRLVTAAEKWLSVPLPSGSQQVQLDAQGDWVRTERLVVLLPVANAPALLDLAGWTDGQNAFLHIQNQSQSRSLTEVARQPVIEMRDVDIDLPGFADGRYRIEVWNTNSSAANTRSDATCHGGHLQMRLPAIAGDIAVKIMRE